MRVGRVPGAGAWDDVAAELAENLDGIEAIRICARHQLVSSSLPGVVLFFLVSDPAVGSLMQRIADDMYGTVLPFLTPPV